MRPFQAPEMARVPLAELCLQVKLLKLGTAGEVLAKVSWELQRLFYDVFGILSVGRSRFWLVLWMFAF